MKHLIDNPLKDGLNGHLSPVDQPRNLLAAIIESSDDAIVSKDLNGVVTSWNEGARRIFGYASDEMVGRSILRLIPPELHFEEAEILRKIRAGERIDHYETVRVRKNGEKFPISVTISPVRDDTGRVVGASKIGREMSDRWRAEENRSRLAAIVDSADDAIISKDLNGIIGSWNDGARRMFGYDEEEMIGQPLMRLIPKELEFEEEENLRKLRNGERIEHFETTRVRKDGRRIDVSVTISPIRNNKGQVIGASKIARDISDRKRMEKLLVQSEKLAATGRMAAAIAHEVNNPLESLMNLIYLARQSSVNPDARAYLLTAESEIERVSHIARQTLGYYRDSSSPSELYLHELIENVLKIYQSKLAARRISVDTNFEDQRRISVSRGEMLQVFSNVITNAIDAMTEGGRLSVSVCRPVGSDGDGVQTIIRDDGSGIHQENIESVFEPFFTTKGSVGNGIGLWVTKQLVERRGGQISITSNTERGVSGTEVSIFIPFANSKAPEKALID